MPDARATLFAGVDGEALARASDVMASRFAVAAALAGVDLVRDPTISPQAVAAGICLAHLLGAAAALEVAVREDVLGIHDIDAIARDAAAVIVGVLGTTESNSR